MKVSELGQDWKKAYECCLQRYMVKEAAAIAKYYRPQKIYKYFSFNPKYWRGNIFRGELAFRYSSSFNDPLDSRWFLDYDKIYNERFKEIGEKWPVKEFDDAFFDILIHLNEEDSSYLRYIFLLCCFSETPHSNLMWSHYASNHTGFCLEYDLSRFPDALQLIMPIVYTESPFDASYILDMYGIDDKYAPICPYLFKSRDWSYEKEWRIILQSKGDEPCIKTVYDAVSGIYFGYNSFGTERDEISNWAENRGIPTYQMERSYMSYDFTSESVKDIRQKKSYSGFIV